MILSTPRLAHTPKKLASSPTRDETVRLQRVRRLVRLLDTRMGIPGTSFRWGLDSLLGLVPLVGDLVGALLSLYLVLEATRLKLPLTLRLRMIGNILLDALLGTVPIAGDVFDLLWKANVKNLQLLETALARRKASQNAH